MWRESAVSSAMPLTCGNGEDSGNSPCGLAKAFPHRLGDLVPLVTSDTPARARVSQSD